MSSGENIRELEEISTKLSLEAERRLKAYEIAVQREYEVEQSRNWRDYFGTEDDFIAICAALKHAPKLRGIRVNNEFHFGVSP